MKAIQHTTVEICPQSLLREGHHDQYTFSQKNYLHIQGWIWLENKWKSMKIAEAIYTPFNGSLFELCWLCSVIFGICLSKEYSWIQLYNWKKSHLHTASHKALHHDCIENRNLTFDPYQTNIPRQVNTEHELL
jgi:hypothetical protein